MAHNSPSGRRTARHWQRIDQAADTDRPQPLMTLAVGANRLTLTGAKRPSNTPPASRRGAITGFSAAARKRLIDLVASIKKSHADGLPLFITLTYPAAWPADAAVWKAHLDAWLKRLDREFTGLSAIWKMEFQSRGAPHFHLLVFGARWIDAKWVARTWYEVVGSGDERHLMAGTEVRRVKSWKGVMFYASKYLAKKTLEQGVSNPGRFWGVYRRERLPIELLTLPLTFGQFFRLRRLLQRWAAGPKDAIAALPSGRRPRWRPRIGNDFQGFTLFADSDRTIQLLAVLVEQCPPQPRP